MAKRKGNHTGKPYEPYVYMKRLNVGSNMEAKLKI
jgi:hypothetical protein